MPNVDETEAEHIDTIIAAMKTADNEEDRRKFARAAARWFEVQLTSMGDRMSAFVDAFTVAK